jgi:hypothetical protein
MIRRVSRRVAFSAMAYLRRRPPCLRTIGTGRTTCRHEANFVPNGAIMPAPIGPIRPSRVRQKICELRPIKRGAPGRAPFLHNCSIVRKCGHSKARSSSARLVIKCPHEEHRVVRARRDRGWVLRWCVWWQRGSAAPNSRPAAAAVSAAAIPAAATAAIPPAAATAVSAATAAAAAVSAGCTRSRSARRGRTGRSCRWPNGNAGPSSAPLSERRRLRFRALQRAISEVRLSVSGPHRLRSGQLLQHDDGSLPARRALTPGARRRASRRGAAPWSRTRTALLCVASCRTFADRQLAISTTFG